MLNLWMFWFALKMAFLHISSSQKDTLESLVDKSPEQNWSHTKVTPTEYQEEWWGPVKYLVPCLNNNNKKSSNWIRFDFW